MDTQPSNVISIDSLRQDAMSLDMLRPQLKIQEALQDLNEVAEIVRNDWEILNKNQIEANRLRVDIARIKLAKVIPDIKAIEHSAGDKSSRVQFVINLGEEQVKK